MTLAIAAVVLSIAVPSFNNLVQNERLTTQANDLIAAISLARSEAAKRGRTTTICAGTAGAGCTGGTAWESGWIVLDNNNNVIKIWDALEGTNTIRSTYNLGRIQYDFRGYLTPSIAGTLTICDDRGASSARAVNISGAGQVRMATDINGNDIVEGVNDGDGDGNADEVTCP